MEIRPIRPKPLPMEYAYFFFLKGNWEPIVSTELGKRFPQFLLKMDTKEICAHYSVSSYKRVTQSTIAANYTRILQNSETRDCMYGLDNLAVCSETEL